MNIVIFSPKPHPEWLINLTKALKAKVHRVSNVSYGHNKLKCRSTLEYLLHNRAEMIIVNADCGPKDAEAYNLLKLAETSAELENLLSSKDKLPQAFYLMKCLSHLDLMVRPGSPIICIGEQVSHQIGSFLELSGATATMLPTDSLLSDPEKLLKRVSSDDRYVKKVIADLYKANKDNLRLLTLDDFSFQDEDGDDI